MLELGSGTGIAGLATAAHGASVTLTDVAGVMPTLAANVEANKQVVAEGGGCARCAVLDWGEVAGDGSGSGRSRFKEWASAAQVSCWPFVHQFSIRCHSVQSLSEL